MIHHCHAEPIRSETHGRRLVSASRLIDKSRSRNPSASFRPFEALRSPQALEEAGKFGMTWEKGITLIELLIGVFFVSIVLAGAFMVFNPLDRLKMADDQKRKEDLTVIQNALEQYYKDVGNYPSSTPNYEIKTIDANDPIKEWGSSWGNYMSVIPKDPKSPKKTYVYVASKTLQAFYLYASLETGDKNPKSGLRSNSVPDTACGGVCNYGVSSANVSP